ncbi:MAG: nucleotidyltransferase family protein [Rhodobacteraceae bacterium]|nr:nucleotidyltransferase family protein [Paracoccaceae bacterium]
MSAVACAILLPAAGASRRMRGGDKLLERLGNAPLLRAIAERALTASDHVAVTLPPGAQARVQALDALPVQLLPVPQAAEGMSASLRAGADWAMGLQVDALMIALPDMPDISAADMQALIAAQARCRDQPLRACTPAGMAGHPTILPRALLPAVMGVQGDTGARALLRAHPPRLFTLAGDRAVTDLDTPEDWARWRG